MEKNRESSADQQQPAPHAAPEADDRPCRSPGYRRPSGVVGDHRRGPLLGGSPRLTSVSQAQAVSDTAVEQRAADTNPLAGRRWGVYKGNADQSWQPYVRSTGENRKLLAKISLRPKAKWFGKWISNATIEDKVREYIANSTGGDPDVLVQMTVFRMVPWEHDTCKRLPTQAEQASYKQ